MLNNTVQKKPLPPRLRKKLRDLLNEIDATRNYEKGVKIHEKYRTRYIFDEILLYQLGFLYNHAVILGNSMSNKKKNFFLKQARTLYKEILAHNPSSVFGYRGLSRVYETEGDFPNAIKYIKKAYVLSKRLPKAKRGIIGIGNTFLQMGNKERAEYWFKKELQDFGVNDLKANVNLLIFYDVIGDYKKALPYAKKIKRLFNQKRDKLLPDKKFNSRQTNKTIALLFERIERVFQRAQDK